MKKLVAGLLSMILAISSLELAGFGSIVAKAETASFAEEYETEIITPEVGALVRAFADDSLHWDEPEVNVGFGSDYAHFYLAERTDSGVFTPLDTRDFANVQYDEENDIFYVCAIEDGDMCLFMGEEVLEAEGIRFQQFLFKNVGNPEHLSKPGSYTFLTANDDILTVNVHADALAWYTTCDPCYESRICGVDDLYTSCEFEYERDMELYLLTDPLSWVAFDVDDYPSILLRTIEDIRDDGRLVGRRYAFDDCWPDEVYSKQNFEYFVYTGEDEPQRYTLTIVRPVADMIGYSAFVEDGIYLRTYIPAEVFGKLDPISVSFRLAGVKVAEYSQKELPSRITKRDGRTLLVLDCPIYAPYMTSDIFVTIVGKNGDLTIEGPSFRDYAEVLIDCENSWQIRDFAYALLTYGAYAQKYFDLNTDDLANATYEGFIEDHVQTFDYESEMRDFQYDFNQINYYKQLMQVENPEITLYGTSLSCFENLGVNLYFDAYLEWVYDELDRDLLSIDGFTSGKTKVTGKINLQDLAKIHSAFVGNEELGEAKILFSGMYLINQNIHSSNKDLSNLAKSLVLVYKTGMDFLNDYVLPWDDMWDTEITPFH